MTQELIDAAVALADVLARENEALAHGDLARASSMLSAKRQAIQVFSETRQRLPRPPRQRPNRQLANEIGQRLDVLASENRKLLEHAIRVQGRVIEIVSHAMPRAANSGYRPDGALATGSVPTLTFSARA